MSLLPYRSRTSSATGSAAALAAAGLAAGSLAAGCGSSSGDSCGPGSAPASGLVAGATGVTMTYGNVSGSPNRDCPDAAAPANVISLSIMGTQTDGAGFLTLCIGRPDLLAKQALMFGPEPGAQVHVVDFNGTAGGCMLTIPQGAAPSGTATTTGMCNNGDDPAGFALKLDAQVTLTRTCGATTDSVPVTLTGTVAVTGPK